MRQTFVHAPDGTLVEKGGPLDIRPVPARSHLSAPQLIRDQMAPLRSMADGGVYDSKSALRAGYKAAGLVEVGNDAPTAPVDHAAPITKAEVGAAYQKVLQGYKPAPLPQQVTPDD